MYFALKTLRLNCKGQGMIESLALAAAVMAFITTVASVLYFSVVHTSMSYLVHEHLVCEQTKGTSSCTQELKTKAKSWLVFGRIRSFESKKTFSKFKAQLKIDLPLRRTMTIRKEMPIL